MKNELSFLLSHQGHFHWSFISKLNSKTKNANIPFFITKFTTTAISNLTKNIIHRVDISQLTL